MTDEQISQKEEPNSYEFGKAGNRHKIYYKEVQDLKYKIQELIFEGLALKEEAYRVIIPKKTEEKLEGDLK